MKVNGKDDIPYMKWKIKNVWNHQPDNLYLIIKWNSKFRHAETILDLYKCCKKIPLKTHGNWHSTHLGPRRGPRPFLLHARALSGERFWESCGLPRAGSVGRARKNGHPKDGRCQTCGPLIRCSNLNVPRCSKPQQKRLVSSNFSVSENVKPWSCTIHLFGLIILTYR